MWLCSQEQKWTQELQIIILHFYPSNAARVVSRVYQSPKPFLSVPEYTYMGHILSCFCAYAQAGALPGMPLCPLCVWRSLRFNSNVTSFVRPTLTFPGRTDHAFTVCLILLLPYIHTHHALSSHKIVSIIYWSRCPSPLLGCELVEGKEPDSSLYLKHNAW